MELRDEVKLSTAIVAETAAVENKVLGLQTILQFPSSALAAWYVIFQKHGSTNPRHLEVLTRCALCAGSNVRQFSIVVAGMVRLQL
jgi:hypothetical protein